MLQYDLEEDIRNNPEILAKVRERANYAQNLYAAMCNMRWQKTETFPILKNDLWSVTWRSAGGVIADLRGEGDYLDWYCSGMGGGIGYDTEEDIRHMERYGFVPEATVTEEILHDMKSLGWHPVPWED